jgi:hypothetical protein
LQPSTIAAASPSPSPVPIQDPTAGWTVYSDATWGYSLKYPSSWYDVSTSTTGPDSVKDFANEKVGAPLLMDSNGVWFHIAVNSSTGTSCTQWNLRNGTSNPKQITMSGLTVTRYTTDDPPSYMAVANVQNGHCYQFSFLSYSQQIRDSSLPTDDAILTTIVFGQSP